MPPFAAPLRHERPYPPMSKIEMLHLMTGKTARIIPHRKIKFKREFVIDYWRIGGLRDKDLIYLTQRRREAESAEGILEL